MVRPDESPDPVTRVLDEVDRLSARRAGAGDVARLLARIDRLPARDLVRFDGRFRRGPWVPNPHPTAIGRDRWPGAGAPALEAVLRIVSADGRERQRAVEELDLTPGVAVLVAVRATDWVAQVRAAAVRRIGSAPPATVVALLPTIELLARDRARTGDLEAVVERRITDADLVGATRSDDDDLRRAAWQRLVRRGTFDPADLASRGAQDADVLVRVLVARSLPSLPAGARRVAAVTLVGDHVGGLAARGLDALVGLDGDPPLVAALSSPNTTLRRSAQDWAGVRGIDAGALYRDRLRRDPTDATTLVATAEMADRADVATILRALEDDRAQVRTAALRAVAVLRPDAAEDAAIREIEAGTSGRAMRLAAALLRRRTPSDVTRDRLVAVALDPSRPLRHRIRATATLRASRWLHLATLLRVRETVPPGEDPRLEAEFGVWAAGSARIVRAPAPDERAIIERALPSLGAARRDAVAFLLRTTS